MQEGSPLRVVISSEDEGGDGEATKYRRATPRPRTTARKGGHS